MWASTGKLMANCHTTVEHEEHSYLTVSQIGLLWSWFKLNSISSPVRLECLNLSGKMPDESDTGKASLRGDSMFCLGCDYHKLDVNLIRTGLTIMWITGYVLIVCYNVLPQIPEICHFPLSVCVPTIHRAKLGMLKRNSCKLTFGNVSLRHVVLLKFYSRLNNFSFIVTSIVVLPTTVGLYTSTRVRSLIGWGSPTGKLMANCHTTVEHKKPSYKCTTWVQGKPYEGISTIPDHEFHFPKTGSADRTIWSDPVQNPMSKQSNTFLVQLF